MKNTSTIPFIVDGHLDLAMNAMILNRDLTKSVAEIREKERDLGWNDYQDRGKGTVALPELREGNIGLVITTMISRFFRKGQSLANYGPTRVAFPTASLCTRPMSTSLVP